MPLYIYKNPETEEIVEVIQTMREDHVYIDDTGLQWRRIFTVPQASIDTQIDPFSQKAFLDKTTGSGTVGDLWDRSSDLSEQRKSIVGEGTDPVKDKTFDKWSAKRGGKKHNLDRRGRKKEITF